MCADPSMWQVKNPEARESILKLVAEAWNIPRKLTHSPAPNPVSLHRADLSTLQSKRYVVAEKSDGVRYLLVLGKYKHSRYSVLVNRAMVIFQVELEAPATMFEGSVFDGELVHQHTTNRPVLLVFDAVMFEGKSLQREMLPARHMCVSSSFLSDECDLADVSSKIHPLCAEPGQIFMYTKKFVTFSLFGSLQRTVKALNHGSDGFIFTPVDEPVQKNTHSTCFKWKHTPSIDIYITAGEGDAGFLLQCQDGANVANLNSAFQDVKFQLVMERGCSLSHGESAVIVEVNVTLEKPNIIKCKFFRLRADKTVANSVKTIRNVLAEVRENISVKELIDVSSVDTAM